jgi:hypothetical protein
MVSVYVCYDSGMKHGKILLVALALGLVLSISTLAYSRTKYEMRNCGMDYLDKVGTTHLQVGCISYVNVHGRGVPFSAIARVDHVKIDLAQTIYGNPTQEEINNDEVTSTSTEVHLNGAVANLLIFSALALLIFSVIKPVRKKFY